MHTNSLRYLIKCIEEALKYAYFFVAVDEQGDAEKKEHLNHHSTQDAKSEPLVSSNQSTVLEQSELSNLESNGN